MVHQLSHLIKEQVPPAKKTQSPPAAQFSGRKTTASLALLALSASIKRIFAQLASFIETVNLSTK